ncbi:hypothetical protein B0H10DRAFT_1963909 [Mycena sp. CBHHK59/15]|nr:hypothetical protein B0H10DRAFT_1963909 [Mycena sp. CBHHK59/15]
MAVALSIWHNLSLKICFRATTEHFCKKCKKTVNVTADWHQKSRHQETADRVVFPDDIERHAKGCDTISEQEVPEDVDQPAPGATPLANPARLSRKDSFDPATTQFLMPVGGRHDSLTGVYTAPLPDIQDSDPEAPPNQLGFTLETYGMDLSQTRAVAEGPGAVPEATELAAAGGWLVLLKLCVGRPNPGATANYARAGFTQQDVAALEQPVPVADTLSIDMSSDSEPGDSSLSFSLSSDLSSSLDSADSCHDWSHLLASDWRLGESSSDSSTSSTGSSSDEDDNMPELHPAGYHDSDDDSSAATGTMRRSRRSWEI